MYCIISKGSPLCLQLIKQNPFNAAIKKYNRQTFTENKEVHVRPVLKEPASESRDVSTDPVLLPFTDKQQVELTLWWLPLKQVDGNAAKDIKRDATKTDHEERGMRKTVSYSLMGKLLPEDLVHPPLLPSAA